MRNLRNEYLILLSVILGMIVIGFVLYFLLSSLARQEAEAQPPTAAAQSEENLRTRVAQVFEQTPTVLPDPNTIIHEVRSLARLETIQYTMEKVIRVEQGQNELGFLFGDRLLFVGHGRVIAGLDLAKMRPEDMWVEDDTLYVRLPRAEVFVSALDNEKSYVYDRDTGLLTKGNIDMERTARAAAETEIVKAAVEDGILSQAQQNGENYMLRLLRALGYPDVVFINDLTPAPGGAGTPPVLETPAPPMTGTQVPTLPPLTQPAP